MNVRLFSIFIIVLGIILFAIGQGLLIANPKLRSWPGMNAESRKLYANNSAERNATRGSAKKIMLSGGIVAFIGVAMRVSAKKPE